MSRYSNQKRAKQAAKRKPASALAASKTAVGPDAMSDIKQRKEFMNSAITALEPAKFTQHLVGWLEATAYMRSRAEAKASKDPIAALGSAIPSYSDADLAAPALRAVADDAVFAFCMVAALRADSAAFEKLETSLTERFGAHFPGVEAFACCRRGPESADTLDNVVGGIIKDLLDGEALDPRDVWNCGLRLLEKARTSNFGQELMVILAQWHRDRWAQITTQQLFNLTRPRVTVPPVEEVLADKRNDQSFIACLLIAATGCVELELDETYSAHLRALARRN